ncbi:hypothetical protein Tco_0973785 [Tanacetum coccineum]|uniref:Uncharacterized protein n=1 Tax=Tanacetum coccineum TaxID=301880 RepID=A0ABQ5E9Q8_9ASTR
MTLEVLWSIVKARFKKTEPVNYMDNFLLLNLKTIFEHHVEDSVWKNQQGLVKVLNWKLYDSCGVHYVTMQNILYYLLVKKVYPLTNHTLHQMFNDVKLQDDYKCEMAFELLRIRSLEVNWDQQVVSELVALRNFAKKTWIKTQYIWCGGTRRCESEVLKKSVTRMEHTYHCQRDIKLKHKHTKHGLCVLKSTSSTNGAVNTAHGVTTASIQDTAVNLTTIDNLSDAVICAFFARVNHSTSVSRPQLKCYQVKDKVVPNNSQVKFKKKEVEDHHRISSISKKTKSVTAYLKDVNARTKKPNVVQTRKEIKRDELI